MKDDKKHSMASDPSSVATAGDQVVPPCSLHLHRPDYTFHCCTRRQIKSLLLPFPHFLRTSRRARSNLVLAPPSLPPDPPWSLSTQCGGYIHTHLRSSTHLWFIYSILYFMWGQQAKLTLKATLHSSCLCLKYKLRSTCFIVQSRAAINIIIKTVDFPYHPAESSSKLAFMNTISLAVLIVADVGVDAPC